MYHSLEYLTICIKTSLYRYFQPPASSLDHVLPAEDVHGRMICLYACYAMLVNSSYSRNLTLVQYLALKN